MPAKVQSTAVKIFGQRGVSGQKIIGLGHSYVHLRTGSRGVTGHVSQQTRHTLVSYSTKHQT